MKKPGARNLIMALILLLLCLLLLLGGLPRVSAWVVVKLALPLAGAAALVLLLIGKLWRKEKPGLGSTITTLILCAIYIFPILMTINIVPAAYPADIRSIGPDITVQWPFAEETVVAWGGDRLEKNLPHAMWGSERWAYDLVMEPYDTSWSTVYLDGAVPQEVLADIVRASYQWMLASLSKKARREIRGECE